MNYYLVFGGEKVPETAYTPQTGQYLPTGKTLIRWVAIGVFKADTAESACQTAAKKKGQMGSYFAVEGYPWGLDLMDGGGSEFGVEEEPLSRLEQMEQRSRELEREVLGLRERVSDEPA